MQFARWYWGPWLLPLLIVSAGCGGESAINSDLDGKLQSMDGGARPNMRFSPANCGRSPLEEAAKGLAAGSYTDLETLGLTDDLAHDGYAGTVFAYGTEAHWDANTCRVFFIGGGHLSLTKFLSYDAPRNEWFQAPDPNFLCSPERLAKDVWSCNNHQYGNEAYDPDTNRLFFGGYGDGIHALTIEDELGSSWKRVTSWPDGQTTYTSMEYFASMQRLVIVDSELLHIIDPDSGKTNQIEGPFPMGDYHYYGVYNPVHDVLLFGSGNGSKALNLLTSDRQVRRVADAPRQFHPDPDESSTLKVLTWDPVSGDYLAYAPSGELFSYDVKADRWSMVDVRLPTGGAVAAAITSYGVVMFIDDDSRVWLYKHHQSNSRLDHAGGIPGVGSAAE